MKPQYSFIIPVFNRPEEIRELLHSMTALEGDYTFEVVVVEDGSTDSAQDVVVDFSEVLTLHYYAKANTGPGDSRNYGMSRAHGSYFIILDSDCLLPPHYLQAMDDYLKTHQPDFFGGPDAAHQDFTSLQRGIDFAMTSFLTTGGVRGHKKQLARFEPRSFNMGLSAQAFQASGGFGKIHPGEDPDLTHRLWQLGFESKLVTEAYVYHKRRVSWIKYAKQVYQFGLVRPILNRWHPTGAKWIFWLPSLWLIASLTAIFTALMSHSELLLLMGCYYGLVFFAALLAHKSIPIAFNALLATLIQFYAYCFGFLRSFTAIVLRGKTPEASFPKLFFK